MNHITIPTAAGQPATMSSLEISFLVESRHDSVKRSIERLAEKGVIQHPPMVEVKNSQGQLVWVYQLEKRDTFVIVAQLSPEFTARVVDRWQELEASASKPAELSRMDILKLAMESEQARIVAEEKLALAAPKVAFVDNYVSAETGSLGLRQVCKLLSAKQNEFTAFLIARQVMYRTTPKSPLQPRAEHMHSGRFEAKTGIAEHEESAHAFVQYKFTAKGVEWIAGEWAKHNVRKEIQL